LNLINISFCWWK